MLKLTLTNTFGSKFNDLNRFALGALEVERVYLANTGVLCGDRGKGIPIIGSAAGAAFMGLEKGV